LNRVCTFHNFSSDHSSLDHHSGSGRIKTAEQQKTLRL